MTGILVLAGYFQMLLASGIVYFKLFNRTARFADLPAIVGISLLVNLLLCNILVAIGLHSQVPWLVITASFLLAIAFIRPRFDLSLDVPAIIVLVIALVLLQGYFRSGYLSIFHGSDAVASWNRWAVAWFSGGFPNFTMNYPQLIPANWSILYAINNAPLESVARTVMPLFSLLLAISFLKSKTPVSVNLAASVTCLSVLLVHFEKFIDEGSVDIAVMYLSWCAIQAGFNLDTTRRVKNLRFELLTGALLATAACLTKQAGWLAVLFLQTIYLLGFRRQARGSDFLLVFSPLLVSAALALPWYAWKLLAVLNGQERDITSFLLVDIHRGRSSMERLLHSYSHLSARLSDAVLAGFFVTAVASAWSSAPARLNLMFACVATAVWAFLFGYDARNLSVAIPLWCMSFAIGLRHLALQIEDVKGKMLTSFAGVPSRYIIAAALLGAIGFGLAVSGRNLPAEQELQVMNRGAAPINTFLVEYFDDPSRRPCDECVLTNYRFMESNSKLAHLYYPQYRVVMTRNARPLWSLENFRKCVESGTVSHVLFSRKTNFSKKFLRYLEYLEGRERAGKLRVIEDNDTFFFAELRSP